MKAACCLCRSACWWSRFCQNSSRICTIPSEGTSCATIMGIVRFCDSSCAAAGASLEERVCLSICKRIAPTNCGRHRLQRPRLLAEFIQHCLDWKWFGSGQSVGCTGYTWGRPDQEIRSQRAIFKPGGGCHAHGVEGRTIGHLLTLCRVSRQ